jgi:hypothetical protein
VVVGVTGICLYANLAGRVAAVSGRATFEIIRERLGPRTAAANLTASFLIKLMMLTSEIGGVAVALQLAIDVGRFMWIPVAAFAVWLVIWRVKFSIMENVAGLLGLCLIISAVAVLAMQPNWGGLLHQATAPVIPEKESAATYWFFAIALFGAAMTPYEVFLFSSGAVEEHWTIEDLGRSRQRPGRVPVGRGAVDISSGLSGNRTAAQPDRGDVTFAAGHARRGGRRRKARTGLPDRRDRGRDIRRGAGNRAVRGLHPRAVPGLDVGQIPQAGRGAAVLFHVVMFIAIAGGAAVLFTWVDRSWSPSCRWCSPQSRCR